VAIAGVPSNLYAIWLSRPGIDYFLCTAVLAVHLALVSQGEVGSLLNGIPVASRPGLYGACAVVVSLTGTLASVSVAQYLNARGDRMRYLKSRFSGELGKTWRSVFFGSILVVAAILVAYAIDSNPNGRKIGSWIFEFAILLALLRLIRLSRIFGGIVDVLVADETDALPEVADVDLGDFLPDVTPKPANRRDPTSS